MLVIAHSIPGLLERLADRGLGDGLAEVDRAAGEPNTASFGGAFLTRKCDACRARARWVGPPPLDACKVGK